MMLRNLLLLFLLLSSTAYAKTYTIDSKASEITFVVGHIASDAHGRFKECEGSLQFNKDRPHMSQVQVEIAVDSIDTGIEKRDRHLMKDDFFDQARYPSITFKSTDWKDRGKNRYTVTGDLTIHGVTKTITFPARLTRTHQDWLTATERLYFEADLEINRHDFGVSGGGGVVSAEVDIQLRIQATAPD